MDALSDKTFIAHCLGVHWDWCEVSWVSVLSFCVALDLGSGPEGACVVIAWIRLAREDSLVGVAGKGIGGLWVLPWRKSWAHSPSGPRWSTVNGRSVILLSNVCWR